MENSASEKVANIEAIADAIDRNRKRINFITGTPFIVWGYAILLGALINFVLLRTTHSLHSYWIWVGICPATALVIHRLNRKASKTKTVFDTLITRIWGIAIGVGISGGGYLGITANDVLTVNPAALLLFAITIAQLITTELFRTESTNKSQVSGTYAALYLCGFWGLYMNCYLFSDTDYASGLWLIKAAVSILFLLIGTGILLNHLRTTQQKKENPKDV
ncbi:MAG: hypothetical protein RR279_07785 [Alistipes sp.]